MARQLSFLPAAPREYGGGSSQGRRKVARPFDRRLAVHATFRASCARGAWSLRQRAHKGLIYLEAERIASESEVRLYRFINVGNHLHVVLKARSRRNLARFLRVFAGRVAMLVTGAKKGSGLQNLKRANSGAATGNAYGAKATQRRFWDFTVHTKLIQWGRQFARLSRYMEKNLAEAEGGGALLIHSGVGIVRAQSPIGLSRVLTS